MPTLTIDKDHIYHYGEIIPPGVSEVVGEWRKANVYGTEYYINVYTGSVISADTMKQAADFGTAIHSGAKLIFDCALNWKALDESLRQPLMNIADYIAKNNINPIYLEKPLYHDVLNFAGIPDFFYEDRAGRLISPDWKTGDFGLVAVKMAAYRQLILKNFKTRKEIHSQVIKVPKDGSPLQVIPVSSHLKHWSFFLNRLSQINYLKGEIYGKN